MADTIITETIKMPEFSRENNPTGEEFLIALSNNIEVRILLDDLITMFNLKAAAPIPIHITDEDAGLSDGIYVPVEEGMYVNLTPNLEYNASEGLTFFIKSNGVWTKNVTPVNFTPTGVVEEGNTEAVSGGEVYFKTMVKDIYLESIGGKNLFDKSNFIQDKMLNGLGQIVDEVGYKISSYIPVKANTNYIISGGFVSAGNHRVSFFENIGGIEPHTYYNSYSFTTPPTDGYVVIYIAAPSGDVSDTLQLEEGTVVTPYEPYIHTEKIKEEYLPETLKPSDIQTGVGINLFNKNGSFIEDMGITSAGALVPAPGSLIVDIPISDSETEITLQGYKTDGNNHRIMFLDSNGVLIPGTVTLFTIQPFITVSKPLANGVTARIWFKHQNDDIDVLDTFMVSYGGEKAQYQPYEEVFKGIYGYPLLYNDESSLTRFNKINFNGDSITYGYASGGGRLPDYFAAMVARNIGVSLNNYGISSSTIARRESDPEARNPIVDRLEAMDLSADIVGIAGGTNDYNYNWTPFGDFDDAIATTFCGALNIICEYLLKNFAGKTVFFSTPIHRGASAANPQGKTLQDYADAIIYIAGTWGIPVIDCYRNVPIIPTLTEHEFLIPDAVHPSVEGHRIMANIITGFIKTL